jgi:hypothetical protein
VSIRKPDFENVRGGVMFQCLIKKLPLPELEKLLFAERRYHEVGNSSKATFESFQKRQRFRRMTVWAGFILLTPVCIGIGMMIHLGTAYGLHDCIPLWFSVSFGIGLDFMCVIQLYVVPARRTYGRWVIAFGGIFHKYGISPHRFVPFSSIQNIRAERINDIFSSIVLETETGELRISERSDGGRLTDTDFLPFLNSLVANLQRNRLENLDLRDLLTFQQRRHRRKVEHVCFFRVDCLMIAGYLVALLLTVSVKSVISGGISPWSILSGAVLWSTIALAIFLNRWKRGQVNRLLKSLGEGGKTE